MIVDEVLSGVPQESIIWIAALLNFYFGLTNKRFTLQVSLFPDDTKIFGNTITQLCQLQEDVHYLEQWRLQWILTAYKCSRLHGGANNPIHGYTLLVINLFNSIEQLSIRFPISLGTNHPKDELPRSAPYG